MPVSESNRRILRETITVPLGETLEAGAVLGKVTASGKHKALDPAAVDGSEIAEAGNAGVADDDRSRRAHRSRDSGVAGKDYQVEVIGRTLERIVGQRLEFQVEKLRGF